MRQFSPRKQNKARQKSARTPQTLMLAALFLLLRVNLDIDVLRALKETAGRDVAGKLEVAEELIAVKVAVVDGDDECLLAIGQGGVDGTHAAAAAVLIQ